MAAVDLRLGDMFDGPSDMIVLPCSTAGTVTKLVAEKLVHYQIPSRPRGGMRLGDLTVSPFEGGENIAQFVAFAASVQVNSSSQEAIYRIGTQLGEHTNQNASIRRISAPLLGTGAGGLRGEIAALSLSDGFRKSAHKSATLVLSILRETAFKTIQSALGSVSYSSAPHVSVVRVPEKTPRVFVSYCHSSAEHAEWVARLGEFLRQNGIDARLDIWHLRRGMDLAQFMTNELAIADRVVLVSDKKYAEKADGRVGGVGWETMIVQGDIANLPSDSTKYLVVVTTKDVGEGLPRYLKTKFVIHWPDASGDEHNRRLLLREIFDAVQVPPLGTRPIFL